MDEFDPAPPATRAKADGGNDGIPAIEQLVQLVTRRVEQLRALPQGLRDLSAAATNTGFDCLRRVDVFDVRGGELVDDPVRISVEQPVRVDPPDEPDVLLRFNSFEQLPGKWQAAILKAEENRPTVGLVPDV